MPSRCTAKAICPFLASLSAAPGSLGNEDTHHSKGASGFYGIDKIVHHQVRNLLARGVVTLITNAFGSAVGS